MTDFKYYLRQITSLYFTPYWDNDTFARAQRLEADIITSRNKKTLSYKEYRALHPLVSHLINEMRDILKKQAQL